MQKGVVVQKGLDPCEEEDIGNDDDPDTPGWDALGVKQEMPSPFPNPDPYTQWCGAKNVARASINGQRCWVLLDHGCQVNSVTPCLPR